MGQLEALATPVALRTWAQKLSNRQLIHFIDNNAVASSLVKGYSPKADSAHIISDYWTLAAKHGIDIYIDRVESKSNLSDGPSRFDLSELILMGGYQVPTIFHPFSSSEIFNFFWEECCAPARAVSVAPPNTS